VNSTLESMGTKTKVFWTVFMALGAAYVCRCGGHLPQRFRLA
jgi:hypothetical protein